MKLINSLSLLALSAVYQVNAQAEIDLMDLEQLEDVMPSFQCGKMYGGKMYGGKMSSSSTGSSASSTPSSCSIPSCYASGGKMYGGKMYGGKMYSSSSSETEERFLHSLERNLRVNGGGGGKMSSGGKMSGGGKMGGGGGCCESSKDSCPLPDTEIFCGAVIVDMRVTLKTGLHCPIGSDDGKNIAITLIGEDAVLDCAGWGDNIIMGEPNTSSGGIGVLLLDGARMENCFVYGFNRNVQMGVSCTSCGMIQGLDFTAQNLDCSELCESDATISVVGSTLFGAKTGIKTEGKGCYSVECSTISGNEMGVHVRNYGDFIMSNTDVFDNAQRGIWFSPEVDLSQALGVDRELNAAIIDSNFFANIRTMLGETGASSPGIQVGDESTPFGKLILDFFGVTKSVGNEGQGLLIDVTGVNGEDRHPLPGNEPLVRIIDYLEIQFSGLHETIEFPDGGNGPQGVLTSLGALNIGENGLLFSCNYNDDVLDVEQSAPGVITDEETDTANICDDDNTSIDCVNICPTVLSAQACTSSCPEGGSGGKMNSSGKMNGSSSNGLQQSSCGKMYGGKMNGGKMDSSSSANGRPRN